MDPLSISASITSIVAFAGATAAKLDALFRDFKSRPAVLLAISQEISTLCLVLGWLEGQRRTNSSGTDENESEKALSAVLDSCMRTFQQIGSQISELQSSLRKGSLSKAYSFMLYPSRMKEISALRDDLEKYKSTLLLALQVHKSTKDSISLEALRQEIEDLRSTMHRPGISVIEDSIPASSTTLFGNVSTSFSGIAGDHRNNQGHAYGPISQDGQVALSPSAPENEPVQNSTHGTSDVPTFGSFNDWLSTFAPDPEIPDPEEDELLSTFRNHQKTNSVNNRTSPFAIDTIENLPIQWNIPAGKIHLIFVNLRKSGFDKTFTEDLVTSPDTPIYKVIHELHQKGYTKTCGFQSVDRQSTYSPMASHDSLVPVVVTAGSPTYNIPTGLQINIDERLINFFNRFVFDDPATPAGDVLSVERVRNSLHIHDRRFSRWHLKFQRTLRVPDDGESYPLPTYFGSYPLLNVETFSDRLPLHMRKKGGLFIPMFQREALSLDFGSILQSSEEHFAVRIYAGSVNAISGKAVQSQLGEGEQDYVVVPKQRRLDGFLAGKGKVRQFVAMPLGFEYSVEKQVTGTEFIGGIQLEIIPRLNDKVKFIRPRHNTTSYWLPQQLDISEDIFRTPRELGMAPGQLLLMQDSWPRKSRRTKVDLGFLENNSMNDIRRDLLPMNKEMCRPTFVHELFLGTGQHTYSMNESLVLHPVEPLSLRVDWQAIMQSSKGTTIEEYSPFLHISDFKRRVASDTGGRYGYLLFNGIVHKGYPGEYSPLAKHLSEGSIISFTEHERTWGFAGSFDPSSGPSWEMALGSGGNLGQSVEKTKDKRLWDWEASKVINIQILNSVAFKAFTGVSPVTPISFREYVQAKIPFYSFVCISEDSMIGDHATTFKSIGQLDHSATVHIGIRVDQSGKPVGCSNCEENICDTILQPCKHIFCSDCIKFTMTTRSSITCVFCGTSVSETIGFSAPMEMPSSPEEQIGLKVIVPEDKVSRCLVTQQGGQEPPSNIVENLVVTLLEMMRDGESPKDTPDAKISDLVADSITYYESTLPFYMAIRNLMQTSIDIRIPIFKAALPKAIKRSLPHVEQLLLLVPNIDDMDDRDKEFVNAALNSAGRYESFVILFKWLTNGRRSIEDFGLSVYKLLKLVYFNDAVDTLLKFVADRKQTLSECGVSIMIVNEDEEYKLGKLIQLGCDPHYQNADGKTLLHLTLHSGKFTETLLALGLRIDTVDNDGNTSIHLAKSHYRLAALIRHESCTPAIINMRNREGLTAYNLSLLRSESIRRQLLDAGADPKMEMPKGQYRDEVVTMLRKIDWAGEGYVLDDGLIQELQDTSRGGGDTAG